MHEDMIAIFDPENNIAALYSIDSKEMTLKKELDYSNSVKQLIFGMFSDIEHTVLGMPGIRRSYTLAAHRIYKDHFLLTHPTNASQLVSYYVLKLSDGHLEDLGKHPGFIHENSR